MKLLVTTLLLSLSLSIVQGQDNAAAQYDDPGDFRVGDVIMLNAPSNGDKYRSVHYTYEAAKNIRPDLKGYSKEKIYLSDQFQNAPFTVVQITGTEALLAYGVMKNFAYLDLEMAIRSGEAGNRENMAPIWLVESMNKGDQVQLTSPSQSTYRSAYFTPKFAKKFLGVRSDEQIHLPARHQGDIFTITNKWDDIVLLGNDSTKDIAFMELKTAVENDEIELRQSQFLSKSDFEAAATETLMDTLTGTDQYETAVDTIEHVGLLDRLGLGLYVAPFIELAGEESASLNYGAALGVVIHNKWQVGGFIQTYGGTFTETIIFPNSFVLDYSYAGAFVAYPVFQKNNLSILVEAKFGLGEAAWSTEESFDVLDSDSFYAINPSVGLDYRLGRIGILNLSVGYRIVPDLELTGLDGSALSSFNVRAMLKIGWFNKLKEEDDEE